MPRRPMVDRGSDASGAVSAKCGENGEGRLAPPLDLRCDGLRLAFPTGHRIAPRGCCALVAKICRRGAAPCVGERHAQGRAFSFGDFLAALVTDENCFTSQDSSWFGGAYAQRVANARRITSVN